MFSCLVFSSLIVVSGNVKVDLALEEQIDVHVVCKLLAILCFFFLGAAPISYVLEAILNLPHP